MFREKQILLDEKKIKQKLNKKKIKANKNKSINYLNKRRNKLLKATKNSTCLSKKIILIILTSIFVSLLSFLFFYIKYKKSLKHIIPIAFSLNDKYFYPLIVSLTSILYNAAPGTFYKFYLLLSPDLQESQIQKILGLREIYPNCEIKLIPMGKKYSKYKTNFYKSVTVFYRMELSNLINDTDKLIYLDVDTITHKDLTELYNIDMGKNYYMGFPGHDLTFIEFHGTRNFINTGCILINLKKLREVNATFLLQDYYNKYGSKKVDEYLINAVFYDKIAFLPLKYGIPDFGAGRRFTRNSSHFLKQFKNYINYTEEEMEYASQHRVITHNCYELVKWWNKDYYNLTKVGKQWLFYAAKSNVMDDICKYYNQFEPYCDQIKKESKNNLII